MHTSIRDFEAQRPQRPAGWYTDPLGGASMRWWDGTEWTKDSDELFATGRSLTPRPLPDTWIAQASQPRRSTGATTLSVLGILLVATAGALALALAGFLFL